MFKLSRYFSIASAIGILVVVTALSFFYHHIATRELVAHETRANVALAKFFANSIWPRYASFVESAASIPREELARRPEIAQLRADVLHQMKGLNVVEVKIHDLNGFTVFSTDPEQIGEDKGNNKGFLSARGGSIASDITFHHQFDAFEQTLVDRNLILAYMPIRKGDADSVEAVFEVYSDVTELVERLQSAQRRIVVGVLLALSFLYLFLLLIVKRADALIKEQEKGRKLNEAKISHQAYHDPLTGLPNRTSFSERVEEALKRAKRTQSFVGLMFLDLDGFKVINESLGHSVGDHLLEVTAQRLRSCVREADMLFRMGGDEFTVIMENLREPEDGALVARRVVESISQPIVLKEHEVTSTISAGIAIYPKDGADGERLIKNADIAMYRAKEAGRNRYEFYTDSMHVKALGRLTLEAKLRRALEAGQFELYYQPKVSMTSGQIVGMEALLRWNDPEKGVLTPDKFLSVLEDSGLMIPVGAWVLRTACEQAKTWQDAGLPRVPISVNVSSREFRSGLLADSVDRVLKETGLEPKYLELELTERLLIDNADAAIDLLEKLKDIGVLISIDDFGAGYSSLNYLRHFPVDVIKIDKSFVKRVIANHKDAAIVSAIISLARDMNLGLVAEGVEQLGQVEFLRTIGCNDAQGNLFGRAVSTQEFEQVLSVGSLGDVLRDPVFAEA